MKNLITKVITLFAFFTLISLSTQAQTTTRKANVRQLNQTSRIQQGVNSGELTRRETKQLVRQQRDINRTKKAAKADGVVTRREKAIINNKQNQANRNIARKKNNARDRN